MFLKILYGGSLLACLVALALVLGGQLHQAERFFSPGGGLEKGTGNFAQGVIGNARKGAAVMRVDRLMRELPVEVVGEARVNARDLRRRLMAADGDSGLDRPLDQGGVKLTVTRGGTLVVLCTKPVHYYCGSYDIETRQTRWGTGPTIAKARARVI